MQQTYHANGKLLISAEYLVLKGALALAVPLSKGQHLTVKECSEPGLQWNARTLTGNWFNAVFDNHLNITGSSSPPHAQRLQNIIRQAIAQNPAVVKKLSNQQVTTQLEFDPQWGWGSSSTLLSLLAQWLEIDPYQLMDATFGGSGYDIACGTAGTPLFYRRETLQPPEISAAPFNPPFIDQLGVVWLNQKQTSSQEVRRFLNRRESHGQLIEEISHITREMATTTDPDIFARLMQQHETLIGRATGQTPVQQSHFPDFEGTIKSLGAWGGDFALFFAPDSLSTARSYFASKGYSTLFPLADLLLQTITEKNKTITKPYK
ncbi:MAG: GYDIA family GHMP kinase [Spirochaetales bacterium]|jgi:mevalonate kinase|nr:GYDIA family GHMP kinase [Spirochaetales bacterium]